MANILQAAKWMQEGKRVRREAMRGSGCFAVDQPDSEDEGFIHWHLESGERGLSDMFEIEDLLADDWEIAEATPTHNPECIKHLDFCVECGSPLMTSLEFKGNDVCADCGTSPEATPE